jgi:hypothetical protein
VDPRPSQATTGIPRQDPEHPRLAEPGEDPVWGDLGKVFPGRQASGRDAILQPPKPEIIPSGRILQLAAEHDTEPDYEAAD